MPVVAGEAAKKIQEQLKIKPSEVTERGKQKLYEMFSKEEPTYELLEIATELDARERSGNCVISRLQTKSWQELCNEAIYILRQLGGIE